MAWLHTSNHHKVTSRAIFPYARRVKRFTPVLPVGILLRLAHNARRIGASRRNQNHKPQAHRRYIHPANNTTITDSMASPVDDTNPAAAADTGADSQPQLSPTSPTSTTSPTSPASATEAAAARLHRPMMQSLPDTRQQSFDEIYGPPENFLEIEVRLSSSSPSHLAKQHSPPAPPRPNKRTKKKTTN